MQDWRKSGVIIAVAVLLTVGKSLAAEAEQPPRAMIDELDVTMEVIGEEVETPEAITNTIELPRRIQQRRDENAAPPNGDGKGRAVEEPQQERQNRGEGRSDNARQVREQSRDARQQQEEVHGQEADRSVESVRELRQEQSEIREQQRNNHAGERAQEIRGQQRGNDGGNGRSR